MTGNVAVLDRAARVLPGLGLLAPARPEGHPPRAGGASMISEITQRYGSTPIIRFFETPAVVDNAHGEVVEDGKT